jgi:hypothetical protein
MNFKTTYILFGILIGFLVLFGLMIAVKRPSDDLGYVFPSFHNEKEPVDTTEIVKVEIDRKGEDKLVLEKGKQGWQLHSPRVRLESNPVASLIREVTQARREENTDVTSNLRLWGLEDPRTTVTLRKADGRSWWLKLGKESKEKDGVVYVNSSDRPKEVLAVKRSSLAAVVNFHFDRVWSRKLLHADPFTTQRVALQGPKKGGKAKQVILKKLPKGGFGFVKPPYGTVEMEASTFILGDKPPKQSPGVRGLLTAIDNLQAESLVEPLGRVNLKKYGVEDGANGLRITVTDAGEGGDEDNKTTAKTLLIGKKVPKKRSKEAEYYARLLPERVVVRVPAKGLDTVQSILADQGEQLRSLKLTQIEPSAADAIEIRNGSKVILLRRSGNNWKLKTDVTGVQKASDVEVQKLLADLKANHQIKQFLDRKTDAELGLNNSRTSIAIWTGGLKEDRSARKKPDYFPALKKGSRPAVKLVFGNTAREQVYVKRVVGKEANRVAVPADLLKKIDQSTLTYLDRNLTPFTVSQVTRMVLERRGRTFEVEKKDKVWKLLNPKSSAATSNTDAANVNHLLTALVKMTVTKWVKVKPTKADRESFGLDKPPVRVVLTVKTHGKKKADQWEFAFGKEVTYDVNRKGVYGRSKRPELDIVFFLDPSLVTLLRDLEIRDRTVFRFNPSEVTELRLEGPYDPRPAKKGGRAPLRVLMYLPLERAQGESWQIMPKKKAPKRPPEGFKLDPQKVDTVLWRLANLKLDRFLEKKLTKKQMPSYGLSPKTRWLYIQLTTGDKKKPLWLTIGKLRDDNFHYAQSSTLPGTVFLISQQEFAMLLGKPPWIEYFSKTAE